MRLAAALLAAAALAGTAGATGPSLQLAARDPLTVSGAGFAPRDRVTLDLSGVVRRHARTTATRTGTFSIDFGLATSRCDLIRVVAVGSSGGRAVLKRLPGPACSSG
jgi:hypothetical protein